MRRARFKIFTTRVRRSSNYANNYSMSFTTGLKIVCKCSMASCRLRGAKRTARKLVRRFSDTSRRIGAMGTAQQIFYSVHNSTDVSGQRLLEAVCTNARAFFSNKVSINCEAAGGSLPKETAMPLALALNELLTNAAKYGANDRGRITINVGLSQRAGEIELFVQDRGPGFDFADAQGRSSGLGLVTMLAERLRGIFSVERRSGARCTLRFPDQ